MPFKDKVAEQAELLSEAGIKVPGVAVDLGCGSGFQSVALAKMGADKVYAIDTSEKLLSELNGHSNGPAIKTICGNLLDFPSLVPEKPDTIVCMGDTLTHLPTCEAVSELFRRVSSVLSNCGRFVLSYRDLTNSPSGLDRFILLNSSRDKIMSCFLERFDDVVRVHDLIYIRGEGEWKLLKSAYPKLILPLNEIKQELNDRGLKLYFEKNQRGMNILALQRE